MRDDLKYLVGLTRIFGNNLKKKKVKKLKKK